jgi:hypothetical protein
MALLSQRRPRLGAWWLAKARRAVGTCVYVCTAHPYTRTPVQQHEGAQGCSRSRMGAGAAAVACRGIMPPERPAHARMRCGLCKGGCRGLSWLGSARRGDCAVTEAPPARHGVSCGAADDVWLVQGRLSRLGLWQAAVQASKEGRGCCAGAQAPCAEAAPRGPRGSADVASRVRHTAMVAAAGLCDRIVAAKGAWLQAWRSVAGAAALQQPFTQCPPLSSSPPTPYLALPSV